MKRFQLLGSILSLPLLLPLAANAQFMDGPAEKFHTVLQTLYNDMIPMASDMMDVVRAIAGIGALWYIAVRVWRHLANAEPIDFFPLLRPFALCMAIGLYPYLLGIMNGILYPTVVVTKEMVKNSHSAVDVLLEERRKAILNSEEWKGLTGNLGGGSQEWEKYEKEGDEDDGLTFSKAFTYSLSLYTSAITYLVKLILSQLLQLLYYAAALCIDAMRTFHLLIISILGPLILCLATYDGLQHTLAIWIARYINVYLWLPIANLFGAMIGKIQQGMLKADLADMAAGNLIGFGQTDIAYLIFLIIAIVGYFSIPSIANYVVHASGANAIMSKTNSMIMKGGAMLVSGGSSAAAGGGGGMSSAGSMVADQPGNDKQHSSMASAGNSEGYQRDGGSYNQQRISGNP